MYNTNIVDYDLVLSEVRAKLIRFLGGYILVVLSLGISLVGKKAKGILCA